MFVGIYIFLSKAIGLILKDIFFSRKNIPSYTFTPRGEGVSELTDRRGCAILALEVVPKNLIFT